MGYRLAAIPESRLARLAEVLAFGAVPVSIGAVLATRSGQLDAARGVIAIAAAVVIAAAALAIALVAAVEMWQRGYLGLGRLFRAALVASAVLAYPAYLAGQALRLPVLNDVSTDIDDPPVFSASRPVLLAREGRIPPGVDRRIRAAQERAYPLVRTIVLDSEPEEAFQIAVKVAKLLKWRIIEEQRPDDRRGQGRIEAIDESRLMRLRDDITIRLRWTGSESRIDIRSASRFGRHDLGANAARILRFIQEVTNPAE